MNRNAIDKSISTNKIGVDWYQSINDQSIYKNIEGPQPG